MTLLAALLKEIIGKLVLWLKSTDKALYTLVEHIQLAIQSFVGKLKSILGNTADSALTTIASTIIGPVVGVIKKAVMLLKQGWRSIKEAVQFLRAPENRGKPLSYLLPQVGIIVITGLSGIGAVVLGEVIEKVLMGIPFLAVNIPVLGSPANLIGMLMGAIVSGVIGAIAIHMINKFTARRQKEDNTAQQIEKKNEILDCQDRGTTVKVQKLIKTKNETVRSMQERRRAAKPEIAAALDAIYREDPEFDEANVELDRMLQNYI